MTGNVKLSAAPTNSCGVYPATMTNAGTLAADWPRGVADAKTAVDLQCAALAAAYSDILGVSQADITWALGQVGLL